VRISTLTIVGLFFLVAAAFITPPDAISQLTAALGMAVIYVLLTLAISRFKSFVQTPATMTKVITVLVCLLSVAVIYATILLQDCFRLRVERYQDEVFGGFSPQALVAGRQGQRFEVTGAVDNRGRAELGPLFVEIFVTEDKKYPIARAPLDVEAGDLSVFGWSGPFPTDIPAGTYYVGWRIDPTKTVPEASEINNTAHIETRQLIVTDQ
jgi:hypothetical protein